MNTLEEKIEELFKLGFGQRYIAKEVHISTNRTGKIIKELGLIRTSTQQGQIIRDKRRANLPIEELKQYYFEDKLSIDKIAEKLNLHKSQLKRRIQELDWEREAPKRIPDSEKISKFTKEQIEELYIKQNRTSHECQNILHISRKSWKRLVKKFIIKKSKSDIQEQKKSTLVKNLQKKYGVDNVMQIKSIQNKRNQTIFKRNGGKHYASTETWKEKHAATRKKNNSWSTSSFEEKVYELLLTKFNKNDIDRQHRDTEYPFNCDFYIRSLKLYIEIQGSAFHDKKPFDPADTYCQGRLNQLLKRNNSYSDQIIDTWTNRDVKKRQVAKTNRLNFKEFYTLKEFQYWFKGITT